MGSPAVLEGAEKFDMDALAKEVDSIRDALRSSRGRSRKKSSKKDKKDKKKKKNQKGRGRAKSKKSSSESDRSSRSRSKSSSSDGSYLRWRQGRRSSRSVDPQTERRFESERRALRSASLTALTAARLIGQANPFQD